MIKDYMKENHLEPNSIEITTKMKRSRDMSLSRGGEEKEKPGEKE